MDLTHMYPHLANDPGQLTCAIWITAATRHSPDPRSQQPAARAPPKMAHHRQEAPHLPLVTLAMAAVVLSMLASLPGALVAGDSPGAESGFTCNADTTEGCDMLMRESGRLTKYMLVAGNYILVRAAADSSRHKHSVGLRCTLNLA